MKTILDEILSDTADEVAAAKAAIPASELRSRLGDAPPVRSLPGALQADFSVIAEIKVRSPSVGPMRAENVAACLEVYERSPGVAAVSVLTNATHFGMDITRLAAARKVLTKPLLRKDFLIDEYQVREARAFGADAVLLMANVLDAARLSGFYDLARELGMQALFEVHDETEIPLLPPDARIVGINSRKFKATDGFVGKSGSSSQDFSLDFSAFALADRLPPGCLKVAESGLTPATIAAATKHFDAALIGTSLLRDPRGPEACLQEIQRALAQSSAP